MANYCSAEDIQVLTGYTIAFNDIGTGSGSTKPTLTQVNSAIADITNVIDLQLSAIGINSQPTDARILGKLKIGCKWGAAAQCGFGTLNNSGNTGDTKPKTFQDLFDAFLKEIIDNPEIYSIVADSSGMYSDYNDDYDLDDEVESYISKDWES